jgi:XTP/dITP diphosphohydrolase
VTLCCATTNQGKLREFRQALAGTFMCEPVEGIERIAPPEETGATFEENAVLKAVYYSKHSDHLVFSDDSGLEVDALGGAPGIHSARFAGADATDEANNRLLLDKLLGVSDRAARFVCVTALARQGEMIRTFRGEVCGVITESPRGEGGFGYDPLFFYPPFGCTFGEATAEEKMRVSHRGRALAAMSAWLLQNASL